MSGQEQTPQHKRGRSIALRVGVGGLLAAAAGVIVWGATLDLSGAVVAPGEVRTEDYLHAVEHLDGGEIDELSMAAGDSVEAGDVLLQIEDTELRAELEILNRQLAATRAELVRLRAEFAGRREWPEEPAALGEDLAWGALSGNGLADETLLTDLEEAAEAALESEQAIFEARAAALTGEIELLGQRMEALREQISGTEALVEALNEVQRTYEEEVSELADLVERQISERHELRQIERELATTGGDIAEREADVRRYRVEIAQAGLEQLQVEREFQSEVADRLSTVQQEFNDLLEQHRALRHRVDRTTVRAPTDGTILQVHTRTVGEVIEPGERVADIVPRDADLVVEARVNPEDIHRIRVGQMADVRLTAFSFRRTPVVEGEVIHISADRLVDEQEGDNYFEVRLRLTPESLEQAVGEAQLLAGMPAEVMILTEDRTLFQYIFEPIRDSLARAMREE